MMKAVYTDKLTYSIVVVVTTSILAYNQTSWSDALFLGCGFGFFIMMIFLISDFFAHKH